MWRNRAAENSDRARWLLPLLLVFVLAGVVAMGRIRQAHTRANLPAQGVPARRMPSDPVTGPSVSLEIDFGNGARRHFDALAWHPGMTVQDALTAAAEFQPEISYTQIGEDQLAFLTRIDGISTDSSHKRHWQYWVNDERADRSFGVFELQAGDRVLWKLAPEE